MNGIKRKYVKWILGLDRRTPNYIVVKETKMEALKRAIKYEEKTRKTEKKIVTECMKEIDRRRIESGESKWKRERKEIMERAYMKEELQKKREEKGAEEIVDEIMGRLIRKEKEERKNKIKESTYNSTYKKIMLEEVPGYLQGKKRRKERKMIARYRWERDERRTVLEERRGKNVQSM